MSVANIGDKEFNSSSHHQPSTRSKQEEYPNAIGIKELTEYFANKEKAEKEKLNKNKAKRQIEEVTLSDSDEESLINQPPLIAPTPEKNKKTPEKLIKKRKRADFEESSDDDSSDEPFTSPIISVTGPPVCYRLSPGRNVTSIVIIKTTKEKKESRSKPVSENDISIMLNDSDDESSNDGEKIIKIPMKKIGKLSNKRTPRRVVKEKSPSPEKEKISEERIRLILRRSTEQSDYKVKMERRSSTRTIKEPVRYTEEISADKSKNNIDTVVRRSSRRLKNKNVSEIPSGDEEDEEDYDIIFSPSKPAQPQNQAKTPRSKVLESVGTSPLKRVCRSRNNPGLDENDTNKANTDDSDNETKKSRSNTPRKSVKIISNAQITKSDVKKRVNFDDNDIELSPKKTPKKDKIINEPVTPKNRQRISKSATPSFKRNNLTPSMHKRNENLKKPKTLFNEARAKLHVSAVPSSLPCREQEFNNIYEFLKGKLVDKTSGCIYISGVPGTGKTATVNEVIRCLKKLESKGELDYFDYLAINGLKLTEPRQAYVKIYHELSCQTLPWEQAQSRLASKFEKSPATAPMTLLLIDELDMLCNKRQDVVYNLLDWPTKQGSKLVVITIANTMDLPERVLKGRVTSRLGLTRLTFYPYNFTQLQEIVEARLKQSDAFRSEAIQFVARKVAAVSGDARRALDICRRSTEIAEAREGPIVLIEDVNNAINEMTCSAMTRAIKACSEMEKAFLQSVVAEIKRTGVEETDFRKVYRQFQNLCTFDGVQPPNTTETLGICSRLSSSRLLLCEHSRADIYQKILLNVSVDDIHYALEKMQL